MRLRPSIDLSRTETIRCRVWQTCCCHCVKSSLCVIPIHEVRTFVLDNIVFASQTEVCMHLNVWKLCDTIYILWFYFVTWCKFEILADAWKFGSWLDLRLGTCLFGSLALAFLFLWGLAKMLGWLETWKFGGLKDAWRSFSLLLLSLFFLLLSFSLSWNFQVLLKWMMSSPSRVFA